MEVDMRPASHRMIKLLRHLAKHETTLEGAQRFHQGTLWAIIHRDWLDMKGNHIVVTQLGWNTLAVYTSSAVDWRKQAGPLSKRVRASLSYRRRATA